MKLIKLTQTHTAQEAAVLTKALKNVAERLDLNQRELALILGFSEASSSRFYRGEKDILPDSKEGELALLLIRLFRSLSAILGGDIPRCQKWFHAFNKHLNGIPSQLVTRLEGLVAVTSYLDVMRGKL